MSKEKSDKWLKLYPNYKAYLIKQSLLINVIAWFLFYLFLIRFDFDDFFQMKAVFTTLFNFVFMLVLDYFLFYKPNKKMHESKS